MSVSSQLLFLFSLSLSLQGQLPCHLFWGIGNKGWYWPFSEEERRLKLLDYRLFFGHVKFLHQSSVVNGSCDPGTAASAHVYTWSGRVLWVRRRMLPRISFDHVDGYFRVLID